MRERRKPNSRRVTRKPRKRPFADISVVPEDEDTEAMIGPGDTEQQASDVRPQPRHPA